ATGEGASPRIGLSGAGFNGSIVFAAPLSAASCCAAVGIAALAFFDEATVAFAEVEAGSDAIADFAALSGLLSFLVVPGGACFCLSSVSSIWIRRSIFSSFFNSASLVVASLSDAHALLQLTAAIAVAASSVPVLARRLKLT